jgi:hypothetical protein
MFIVAWEGTPPPDKDEWTEILREVLAGELGSYRVVFRRVARGWRFELEWRDDGRTGDVELVANSPDSVGYNIYVNLAGGGKPLDPGWRPLRPGESPAPEPEPPARSPAPDEPVRAAAGPAPRPRPPAKAASSSPAAPPSRPGAGKRTRPGR